MNVYVPCVLPDDPRQMATTVCCLTVFVGKFVLMVSCTNAPNGRLGFEASRRRRPSMIVDGLRWLETPVLDGKALSMRVTFSARAMTITLGQHKPYGSMCQMHRIHSCKTYYNSRCHRHVLPLLLDLHELA